MTKEFVASCALLFGGGYICARALLVRGPARNRREWALLVARDQVRHPLGLMLWLFGFLVVVLS